jgi:hypothetical protein
MADAAHLRFSKNTLDKQNKFEARAFYEYVLEGHEFMNLPEPKEKFNPSKILSRLPEFKEASDTKQFSLTVTADLMKSSGFSDQEISDRVTKITPQEYNKMYNKVHGHGNEAIHCCEHSVDCPNKTSQYCKTTCNHIGLLHSPYHGIDYRTNGENPDFKESHSCDWYDESNRGDIKSDQCCYEVIYGSPCTNKNCFGRKHYLNVDDKKGDESALSNYDFPSVVDPKCVWAVFLFTPGVGYKMIGQATATSQGGWITVAHVFCDENGQCFPTEQFYVSQDSLHYYKIDRIMYPSDKYKSSDPALVWDFAKFWVAPNSDNTKALIDAQEHGVTPTIFRLSSAKNLRMLHYDNEVKCVSEDRGNIVDYGNGFIDYPIATIEGYSGSPLFDMKVRFVGIHKKRGDGRTYNRGIYFGTGGVLSLFFLTQSFPKNQ